jgi:AcrR family transcriptional regulator
LLAESAAVSMNEIAKRAGVGAGTLYRHFPTREELILAAYIRVKHGLGEALHNAAIQNAIDETYAPVVAAVTKLLDACAADNSVRRDLDPADVLLLMGYLWRVAPDEDGIRQGRRLTQIVLDGIRTGRPGGEPA